MITPNWRYLGQPQIFFRPLDIDDIDERYLQWINDQDVVLGNLDVRFPMTQEKQIEYVSGQPARDDVALFAIMEKSTNKFIGTAKFGPIDWISRHSVHAMMIGDKSKWGKGYGGEVIQLFLEYGFRHLNMHKIYAVVTASNKPSIRKNERIGYKTEAVFKDKTFVNGKYVDQVVMSMSQDEFLKLYPESILQNSGG